MEYTVKAKKVTYNTLRKELIPHFTGKPGDVTFDSISEYKCYKVLEGLGLPIEVHRLVPHLGWKVDFSIHFLTESQKDIPLLSGDRYRLHKNKVLYMEYKGVIDKETTVRFSTFPIIIRKTIVVVTPEENSINFYDGATNNAVVIPTLSLKQLKRVLSYAC